MDGVILIDKPAGPTSHDVVAWARRLASQRTIGHTGTLDPMATGLLVLVLGKATRLSSLLTGKDKTYEAEIRLGFATDTDDAEGTPLGSPAASLPHDRRVQEALETFRGSFEQRPPSHSAKKIAGKPAYRLARRHEPVDLQPVRVSLRSFDWLGRDGDRVRIRLTVAAGFYVRALARDLGEGLGCGGHLSALRRTASGSFQLGGALTLAEAADPGLDLVKRLIQPADAIPEVPAIRLTEAGLRRALHGNPIGPSEIVGPSGETGALAKILDSDGHLAALGRWRDGTLHPIAVLG